MATTKNQTVRKRGRGSSIVIQYQRRQGFMTQMGPWALYPHADDETFWPGVEYAAPVKIFNADGTLREIVSAQDFRSRRIAQQTNPLPKVKMKRRPNGRYR